MHCTAFQKTSKIEWDLLSAMTEWRLYNVLVHWLVFARIVQCALCIYINRSHSLFDLMYDMWKAYGIVFSR